MKRLFKAMVMTGFFSLFLLFLSSPSQAYYGYSRTPSYPYYGSYPTTSSTGTGYIPVTGSYPSYPYSYYSPSNYSQSPINVNLNMNGFPSTNYSLPPININLNMNGSPYYSQQAPVYGGYGPYAVSNGPYYAPIQAPTYGVYGGVIGTPYAPSESPYYPATYDVLYNSSLISSSSDGEYIYVAFQETGGQDRAAVAIFKASDSGDCEYISKVILCENDNDGVPGKILIRGDLAIIGATDRGTVYFVDISDKEKPKLINTLVLGKEFQEADESGEITGLAVEGQVLFVSVNLMEANKAVLYALDISNPKDTDAKYDLLDSFVIDSNGDESDEFGIFYGITSIPGYLYISGLYVDGTVVFTIDTSDPENMSLVNILKMPNGDYLHPEVRSVAVAENGDYLFATLTEKYIAYSHDGSFEFKAISISDPQNPRISSSSVELTGEQIMGYENIVIKDNYAYVATSTRNPSKSKIYVFDVSNLEKPSLVKTSKNIDGFGLNLYFAGGDLCFHTAQTMTMFDISDPENLSVTKSIDLESVLEDELDGWEVNEGLSSINQYPSTYGYGSPYFNPNTGGYYGYGSAGYGLASINQYPSTYGYGGPYFNPNTGGYYGYGGGYASTYGF